MDIVTLNIAWGSAPPQRFIFDNIAPAVEAGKAVLVKSNQCELKLELIDGYIARSAQEEPIVCGDLSLWLDFSTAESLTDVVMEFALNASDQPEADDPLFHYVLMRQDVPDYLSGKAMAQANHAGTKMVMDALDSGDYDLVNLVNQWGAEGGGFGTCIVLGVTAPEMRQAVTLGKLMGLHAGIVHDPSYPLRDGEKIQTIPLDTCGFIFGSKSDCAPIVGKFPLLRDKNEK